VDQNEAEWDCKTASKPTCYSNSSCQELCACVLAAALGARTPNRTWARSRLWWIVWGPRVLRKALLRPWLHASRVKVEKSGRRH
jgi:hypothetical protein